MSKETICILIAMVVYMLAVMVIGILYAKKNKTADDFYLGGRKLGPLVTAMSAEASDMSSYLLMGVPGVAFLFGIADAGWTAIGLAIGTYVNWLIVAKRLRRYSVIANNSITIPDFFSNRFGDKRRILMCVSALIILVFFVPYTASGFAACGKLFTNLFDTSYMTAMVISAVVIVAYTSIGGFLAASTTDLMQGILMSVALIVVFGYGVSTAGGFGAVVENAKSIPGYFSMFSTYAPAAGESSPYGFLTIISTMAWGLGYFGMPHVLLRFMAIKNENHLKTSRRIATIWVVISLAVAVLIGVIGAAAIPQLIDRASLIGADSNTVGAAAAKAETIFIVISQYLGQHSVSAALLAGVILAGILAATMSTADSQLLAASSSISQNFFKGIICPKAKDKTAMWVARGTVIVIAVIAVFIASNPNSSIFGIVSFAWAGFGAAFGPVMLYSLFWKRTTLWGALAGMLSGSAMVFIWKFLIKPLGGVWGIYELLPAFVVACIAILVVSLLTKAPSKEITDQFDAAASNKPLEELA